MSSPSPRPWAQPFSWWRIVDLAAECGLKHLGSVAFDRCLYPGYVNRKVLDKKSFPVHDALTYIFAASTDPAYEPASVRARGLHLLGRGAAPAGPVLRALIRRVVDGEEDRDDIPEGLCR